MSMKSDELEREKEGKLDETNKPTYHNREFVAMTMTMTKTITMTMTITTTMTMTTTMTTTMTMSMTMTMTMTLSPGEWFGGAYESLLLRGLLLCSCHHSLHAIIMLCACVCACI